MSGETYHSCRRVAILEKYRDRIKALEGNDPRTAIGVLGYVGLQMGIAIAAGLFQWPLACIIVIGYTIGGLASQALFFALHEASHRLIFVSEIANQALLYAINAPFALPVVHSFYKYHWDHHRELNVIGKDPDVALEWERALPKPLWMAIQMPLYILRPVACIPRTFNVKDVQNTLAMLAVHVPITWILGWRPLLYLISSVLMGGGLHPLAGHFIAEHCLPSKGVIDKSVGRPQETASTYGWLNKLLFNGGYHVEHHDFPNIPCWRLQELHRIASEFYDGLTSHSTWYSAAWGFLTNHLYKLSNRVLHNKKNN